MSDLSNIGIHRALLFLMVVTSAADGDMSDREISAIGESIRLLPVFADFDTSQIGQIANECVDILQEEGGLDTVLGLARDALNPWRLRETAYALACEISAMDGPLTDEETRLLEIIRIELELGRLSAAAIERCVRARHTTPENAGA
ncbi:MAG: tellurite resistance TerB family protein [Alphaproteobacteria bacterium]|nr:tellurite resistance TerB family protein [Alphaproteobacteria bacterium SS10]